MLVHLLRGYSVHLAPDEHGNTDHIPPNGHLFRINEAVPPHCPNCHNITECINHFLFFYHKYAKQRRISATPSTISTTQADSSAFMESQAHLWRYKSGSNREEQTELAFYALPKLVVGNPTVLFKQSLVFLVVSVIPINDA